MEDIDQEFLAWFAGFWEGEGNLWVSLKKEKSGKRPGRVDFSVSQTIEAPIVLIQSKLGGWTHRGNPQKPNWSPRFEWHLTNRHDVIELLPKILPYLRFRQKEVSTKLDALITFDEVSPYRRWTPEEIEIVRRNWRFPDKEIAKILERRTWRAVTHLRQKLALKKQQHRKPGFFGHRGEKPLHLEIDDVGFLGGKKWLEEYERGAGR